ncbi:sporulation protein YabP [Ruminococcaceae bacterium FB2012]|nr:sporulation protein YabP [Ruminococcaceae bacterium FB2012]
MTDMTGSHSLILENRSRLELTGVTDVDRFDEQEIALFTQQGELTIRGSGLHINEMSVGSGKLSVEGEVTALIYGDKDRKKKLSFLGKLVK